MNVGSKETFALAFEIVPSNGDAILGHFGMWANGHLIGDFEDVVVLTAVEGCLSDALRNTNRRNDPQLANMNKEEAFGVLHRSIYGEARDVEEAAVLSEKYRHFDLTCVGISSFDSLFVFLIDTTRSQRLIWRSKRDGQVFEALLATGTFEAIGREFLKSFEAALRLK